MGKHVLMHNTCEMIRELAPDLPNTPLEMYYTRQLTVGPRYQVAKCRHYDFTSPDIPTPNRLSLFSTNVTIPVADDEKYYAHARW